MRQKNGVGSNPMVVAIVEDITEKKKSEESLQRSETNLQRLAGRLIQVQERGTSADRPELHDNLNQRLALIAIDLGILSLPFSKSEQHSQSDIVSDIYSAKGSHN